MMYFEGLLFRLRLDAIFVVSPPITFMLICVTMLQMAIFALPNWLLSVSVKLAYYHPLGSLLLKRYKAVILMYLILCYLELYLKAYSVVLLNM